MTHRAKPRAAVTEVWDDPEAADLETTQPNSTDAAMIPDDEAPENELGEPIAVEDEITDDFEEQARPAPVAVAVDGDDSHSVTAAAAAARAVAKTKKVSPMAATQDMTKADYIRAEIERRKTAGDSTRPRDIIEALAKKNVKVTAPQVSVLVKKLVGPTLKAAPKDQTPAQKAKAAIGRVTRAATAVKKPATATEAAPAAAPAHRAAAKAKPSTKGDENYTALFAAAGFVGACGDIAAARKTLDAYEKLTRSRA